MEEYYTLKVAGLTRKLKRYPISDKLDIAAFILFGDVELTIACARELLTKVPEFDLLFTPEAKSIPLAYEMARQSGKPYIVARKGVKVYMSDPIKAEVHSITTQKEQFLYVGQEDASQMRGKRVLVVDDVISTGDSLGAMKVLCRTCWCSIGRLLRRAGRGGCERARGYRYPFSSAPVAPVTFWIACVRCIVTPRARPHVPQHAGARMLFALRQTKCKGYGQKSADSRSPRVVSQAPFTQRLRVGCGRGVCLWPAMLAGRKCIFRQAAYSGAAGAAPPIACLRSFWYRAACTNSGEGVRGLALLTDLTKAVGENE